MSDAWQDGVYDALLEARVRQVAYVPDAGHKRLIERRHGNPALATTVLTTEEESSALLAGAYFGGDRAEHCWCNTAHGVDLAGVARVCGFGASETVRAPGPLFAAIKVAPDPTRIELAPRDGPVLRSRFRAALLGGDGAL